MEIDVVSAGLGLAGRKIWAHGARYSGVARGCGTAWPRAGGRIWTTSRPTGRPVHL